MAADGLYNIALRRRDAAAISIKWSSNITVTLGYKSYFVVQLLQYDFSKKKRFFVFTINFLVIFFL
jgi:hypothetical protein